MKNEKTRKLIGCAILVAVATVCSMVKIWEAPYGGSVTLFSMLPILLASCTFGVKWGVASGFVYSVLQLVLGMSNLSYMPTAWATVACILLDYVLAFTVLGLAGALTKDGIKSGRDLAKASACAFVCILARYVCHIVSGAVIWYALDKIWYEGDATHLVNRYGAWAFSAIYNGTFMLPETVMTMFAFPFVAELAGRVMRKK